VCTIISSICNFNLFLKENENLSLPFEDINQNYKEHTKSFMNLDDYFFIGNMRVKLLNFIIVYKNLLSGFQTHDLSHRGYCLLPLDQNLILNVNGH
jgi:hypothetical protein